jgi:hypothetical protein
MITVEIDGQRIQYLTDLGWQTTDRMLKLRLETETESMPDVYYPNYENAVAEFVAKRLRGKVIELNKAAQPRAGVEY